MVFIIAEAGVNHNGRIEIAKELIDVAAGCGADVVKFQTFKTENEISRYAPKAEYQKELTSDDESQFEMVKKLELDAEAHRILIDHCDEKGIVFLSSPFDLDSIDLLNDLGLETLKIPSGEITNLPYLRKIGGLGRKLILSTGMSTLDEIGEALDVLVASGTPLSQIAVLQCNTQYPTPMSDVNLRAMISIRDRFGVEVGYSDHSLGIEVPIAAVALGASIIEKHFTLDKTMAGPDHQASLEPDQLREMVKAIRNIEQALGDGVKKPSDSELNNRPIVRKSIVATCNIRKDEVFTEENITTKRPGTGIDPMLWDEMLGKQAIRDFAEDELIEI